jgi:DNA-binding response OmpR family regulator
MHILILDHEELMHTTLEFKLQKAGMSPIFATSTKEILNKLNDSDIVVTILDLDTNKEDTERIIAACTNNTGYSIPVLGITSLEDEDSILYWLQEGIHDFIAKPYKTSEIIIRIKKALSLAVAKH